MQQFVTGFAGCPAIVDGPLDVGRPRDPLRDTSTMIQSIRVWCWAIVQNDLAAQMTASGPSVEITPELIQGIMANAEKLSADDEDWSQTLVTFSGGEITCTDQERCRLSLLDGKNPPELSVDFDLIMATGDEQFILVTQVIYGRSGFVYGVRWRESEDGGEVSSEPPRVYRRAKLSENCPLWNMHKRRRFRSRIHPSSANARFGWRWNTAMSIKAKLRR